MKEMLAAFAAVAVLAVPATAVPAVGRSAPNFKLADANGKPVMLSDFRGRTVVLEWNNPGCPFVQKHYESGNMQKAQAAAARDGAVWLSINSGAPGKQGHMSGAEAKAFVAKAGARPTAYLLDPRGVVGKAYEAKTTPHMYIINKAGTLVYAGGIDDKPTRNASDINGARNHVLAALAEMKAGKGVSVATSRPYGCAVKYGDS
ncbi:MAG: Alkyl hydroperoxide reductase and/or thiol-specific antioxidant family (AhpC/TSA) protein [uncultured Sphingomonas sp.]|uniref:Alkyl hydroperoxide reductase and/or thiol-specific antioxidant family (AhpC/TSA) protein n=1 Tax=uncultured Sphingomonas sp. TaxID=158754 RepID=A0A6J4SW10_9SPHN|nr:redoxin domain-containing protein [uncultured Sphingomonas sp.]CAA9506763.1 MAG: Alkyl hydroperoxide reductase and/or thiol-specific antioxidant family (AhpC/TSA) protein [uncultured Sphingomonas sp.]